MSTTDLEGSDVAPSHNTESGLDENVAGALSYLLGAITGVIFFVIETENPFVRFHAAQSIVFSVGLFAVSVVLSIVGAIVTGLAFLGGGGSILSGIMALVWLVFTLAVFGVWIYLMFRAYQGESPRIPVIAGLADQLVS